MQNTLDYFLTKLENADNMAKNEIENSIVKFGNKAIPELVDTLQEAHGVKRGVVAMSLIRLGEDSVEYLRKAAAKNHDFEWVAKYLISEIEGQVA
ncbi:MAG: hypothetical protein DKM22_02745 [Candidatus Melainabacteria bacterium]|nr:MAG: hypothetical protein DKM22_02745 [Candidatus Melainabacteria bacterium]